MDISLIETVTLNQPYKSFLFVDLDAVINRFTSLYQLKAQYIWI